MLEKQSDIDDPFKSDDSIDETKKTEENIKGMIKSSDNSSGNIHSSYGASFNVEEKKKTSIRKKENSSIIESPHKNLSLSINNLSLNDINPAIQRSKESFYDPSLDISSVHDVALLDEESQETNRISYKEDMIYLSNIYDLFKTLNNKFERLIENNYVDKKTVLDLYSGTNDENTRSKIEEILTKSDLNKFQEEQFISFVKFIFPKEHKIIEQNIVEIQETKNIMFLFLEELEEKNNKLNSTLRSFKNEINAQLNDFAREYDKLNSKIGKGEMLEELDYSGESTLTFFLNHLLTSIKSVIREFEELKEEFVKYKENHDTNDLSKIIEENKNTIKKLQRENLTFSEAVNRLSETNIKLKKDCVMISSEFKKIQENNKQYKKAIEKQRKIIEILQRKLGGNDFETLIFDLNNKLETLKSKIRDEKDKEKKNCMLKEYEDYERRLRDIVSLKK